MQHLTTLRMLLLLLLLPQGGALVRHGVDDSLEMRMQLQRKLQRPVAGHRVRRRLQFRLQRPVGCDRLLPPLQQPLSWLKLLFRMKQGERHLLVLSQNLITFSTAT